MITHWFDEFVYADAFMHSPRALLAPEERPIPQCARCGELGPFGTVHVCADIEALLAAPVPAATCPCCGQPTRQPQPAKDTNVAHEPPPSGWREKPSQL